MLLQGKGTCKKSYKVLIQMTTLQNTNPIYMDWLTMALIVTKQRYIGRNNVDHILSSSLVNRFCLSYPGLWAEVIHISLNKIDR